MKKPKVVILGAGYGGLMTAVRLQKLVGVNDVDIVLVNQNDYHYETTWLHEASAGTLHHDRVRYGIHDVIDRNKIQFVQDTVLKVQKEEKKVILAKGEITYDYLVIALGGEPETFGIKGLKEYAFGIINVDSSRQLREHIEYQFATYNMEEEKNEDRLSIIVCGAGFTGMEFLGELTNRMPELCHEYDIDRTKVRITCVEAAPMALPGFDPELVKYAVSQLERKGVKFSIGTPVKECTPQGVIVGIKDDELLEMKAETVVWTAGIRGNAIIEKSGFEAKRARVKVNPDLRVPGFDDIFIIGDSSLFMNEESNRPYPPTAQIALQEGQATARNLAALIRNKTELEPFKPDIKGTVCALGDDDAIGVVFGKKIMGFKASFMKKVIDNRSLFMIGGLRMMLKKGKFNFF